MSIYSTTVSHQSHEIQDGQSYEVTFTLLDEDDVAVGAARMTSATLTHIDRASGRTINSRLNQNVLNANNVTIDANGVVIWAMQPADTALQRQTAREWHIATFSFVWDAGVGAFDHQVYTHVNALEPV